MSERTDQIIFVHGLADFSKSWRQLREWLEPEGFQIHFFDYPTFDNALDIPAIAATLNEYIPLTAGDYPFQIVAHSQGGLIAEWYDFFGDDHPNLKQIITIATPFHGNSLPLIARNWLDHIPFSRRQIQHLSTFSLIMKRLLQCRIRKQMSVTPYHSIIGHVGEIFGIEGDLVVSVCEGNRSAYIYRYRDGIIESYEHLFTPSVIVKNSHLPVSFLHNLLSDETLFKKALMSLLLGEAPEIEPPEPLNQAGIILPAELEKEIALPPYIRTVVSRVTSDPGYVLVFTNSEMSSVSEIKIKGQPVNLQPGVMTYILKNDFFV